jgi:hypothetical protein
MSNSRIQLTELTRRRFLGNVYTGLGGIGLLNLLESAVSAEETMWRPGSGQTHHPPKAKRVLQIFCPGAASAMDLWEHKPSLEKYHGKPLSFLSRQGTPWERRDCAVSVSAERPEGVIEQKLNPDYPKTTLKGGTGKGIWIR